MKMPKFRDLNKVKKIALLSSVGALVVVVTGVSVYAMQLKADQSEESNAVTPTRVDTPKVENTPAPRETPKIEEPTPVQTETEPETPVAQAPEQTSAQNTAPEDAANQELEKNCGLVNSTIEHLRSTYAARGATAGNQDILNDLRTNPRASSAYSFYQQCVDAGKTQAL